MMIRAIAILGLACSSATSAQMVRDLVTPPIGTPAIASVGDTVFEKSRYSALPAFVVDQSFSGTNIFAVVTIVPGDKFVQIPSKGKIKACRSPSVEAFVKGLYDACLYDDDSNGTFDRYGGNEVQGGKKLPTPLAYKESEFVSATSNAVKQTVIFLGSTKDSVRMSYREFINDMARPAFTEEYTFPLGATYPQTIGFKGVKLSVNSIDGEGLHYSIISAPAN